jgi:hypothetical protein
MVGEVAPADPLMPVVPGPGKSLMGLGVALRRGRVTPRQGAVHLITSAQAPPRYRERTLDPQVQVRCELNLGLAVKHRLHLTVAASHVPPGAASPTVLMRRLALQDEVNGAAQAPDRAEQDVLGAVVGWRPLVQGRSARLVPPWAHEQHIADDRPARRRAPRGLQDHRPGQVAPPGGHHDVRGPQPERARAAVQYGPEDARTVHPRQAHPFDGSARGDERGYHAVGEESVVGDRGKRAPSLCGMLPRCGQVYGRDRTIVAAGQFIIDGHGVPLGAQHTRQQPHRYAQ